MAEEEARREAVRLHRVFTSNYIVKSLLAIFLSLQERMEKLEKERLEREEQQRLEAQRKKEEIEVQQSEVVSDFCSTVAQSN